MVVVDEVKGEADRNHAAAVAPAAVDEAEVDNPAPEEEAEAAAQNGDAEAVASQLRI